MRYVRIHVGYYEELCEEGRSVKAAGGKPSALQLHACQRLKEIREHYMSHPNARYDEEKKVLVIEG